MEKINGNARNYGIDLLRMVSMFMIVILHICGQGGVYKKATFLTDTYEMAWLLEIMAFCSVDCFAIISGFIGAESNFRLSKFIQLWCQVVFYTLSITAIFNYFCPHEIVLENWLNAILPITRSQYWYFRAYAGMYFLCPYLNKLLNALKEREMVVLGLGVFIIFSVYPSLVCKDAFWTQEGNSVFGLILFYLIGGIIRRLKNRIKLKKSKCILIYIVCVTIGWGWKYIVEYLKIENIEPNMFMRNTAVTTVISAIALVICFGQMNFRKEVARRTISIGGKTAFSVYLIHTHLLIYDGILDDRFIYMVSYSPIRLLFELLLVASGIYILCTLIDILRIQIFKLIKIKEFSVFLEEKCSYIISAVVNKVLE